MVASLELCKKLYELSGWKDAPFVHRLAVTRGNREPVSVDVEVNRMADWLFEPDITGTPPQYARAYDLGYLLRKLPHSLNDSPNINEFSLYFMDEWNAGYTDTVFECSADTPENAACKLCCELIRQGLIKP